MMVSVLNNTRELYWELTTSCQLACRYCFYETGLSFRRHKRVYPTDARSLISDLKECFGAVTFTGGEVLLAPSFWEIVAIAREANMRVSFITDGLRLDARVRECLRDNRVSRVAISLDSLSPKINDSVRVPVAGAVMGGADTIIANVRALANNRPPGLEICILQTIYRTNIESITPMVQFCRELDVDLLVHPAGMPITKTLEDLRLETVTDTQAEELEEAMTKWADSRPLRIGYARAAIAFIRGDRPRDLVCPMGTTSFFLDVIGDLFPCFYRKDLRLGNIWTERLTDIMARTSDLGLASAPCASLACSCLLDCQAHVPGSVGQGMAVATGCDPNACARS